MSVESNNLNKLKWRCHRGTKELDFLLQGYLKKHYVQANSEDQQLFIELLKFQDSQLILFLLGEQIPKSEGLTRLVKKIRDNTSI
jgi:antitoxin CptB